MVHIPTVLGAVVVAYNAPGREDASASRPRPWPTSSWGRSPSGTTRRSSPTTPASASPTWRSPSPAAPTARAPTPSSPTTSPRSPPECKSKVGAGTSVNWPIGLGGKGNDGVTGLVKSTPGAVGYVELVYAIQQKLAVADLKNKDGNLVKASIESRLRRGSQCGDPRRLPGVDHQRPGQGRLSHLRLHLAPGPQGHAKDQRQGHGDRELPLVGAHRRREAGRRRSTTRRCRRRCSSGCRRPSTS